MTEIKKYNEDIPKNQDFFSNNLSTKDLKTEIINSLKDEKISPEEAKKLKELFWEINNINAEARKAWTKLSLEIRKNFQKSIWASEDWKIWKETLTKLENITNIKISLDNPEIKNLQENFFNNIWETRYNLWNIWINLDPKNYPEKIFIQADNNWNLNIFNETQEIPKAVTVSENQIWEWLGIFSSLSEAQTRSLEQKINKNLWQLKVLWYQVKSIQLSTENDNIWSYSNWDDQWESFWFSTKIILEKNNNFYMLKWNIAAYSNWTETIINWNKKNFINNSWKDFLDVWNIQLLKWVYNKNDNWDKINIFIWWWLQARWMAPKFMKKIQNSWHNFIWAYENWSEYNWEKWFSPTIWVDINWKKYFNWNEKKWFYSWANLYWNIALDNKWISNINTEAFLWMNYKKVDLQSWIWYSKTFWWDSEVLKFSNWANTYLFNKISIWVWQNSSVFVDLKLNPSLKISSNDKINDRSQISLWFQKKF